MHKQLDTCQQFKDKMSEVPIYNEELIFSSDKVCGSVSRDDDLPSLRVNRDKEISCEEYTRPVGNWSETFSSLSNVNAKLAWKNGAEKLSQTLNNVRTTFGVLSQRIKKSTKRRKPLVNMDSPRSPATPYTRSKLSLGRTPTKLYSPFTVDTPVGKENNFGRISKSKSFTYSGNTKDGNKKPRRTKLNLEVCDSDTKTGETVLANDMLETQIGIYEFQSVANKIVLNRPKK